MYVYLGDVIATTSISTTSKKADATGSWLPVSLNAPRRQRTSFLGQMFHEKPALLRGPRCSTRIHLRIICYPRANTAPNVIRITQWAG